MARSPLLGIPRPDPRAPGHGDLVLGPSDSSDSGSDLAGLDTPDTADPDLPLDRVLAGDTTHPLGAPDARGNASDTAGTGERRSAAGDAGGPDGSDIGVDRVFSPFGDGEDAEAVEVGAAGLPPGALLERVGNDAVTDDEAADEPVEDEAADPVGDGRSDAALAQRMNHRPGHPNPEPDPPVDNTPMPAPPDDGAPGDDTREHQPGRDPAVGAPRAAQVRRTPSAGRRRARSRVARLGGGRQLPSR